MRRLHNSINHPRIHPNGSIRLHHEVPMVESIVLNNANLGALVQLHGQIANIVRRHDPISSPIVYRYRSRDPPQRIRRWPFHSVILHIVPLAVVEVSEAAGHQQLMEML